MIEAHLLGREVSNHRIFRGSKTTPFLAPRGVCLHNKILFVSDTGRNRIFLWKQLPKDEYQEPDIILGQLSVDETKRNSGKDVTASSLQYPSSVWSDGTIIIVADAWNHRVLIWHTFPKNFAQPADVVIGQADFYSNQPNVNGLKEKPSSQSLYWPYGVFSDSKSLWIADTGNRRVLFYKKIPKDNFSKATKVIGKSTFSSRDYSNEEPIWPYSIKVGEKGQFAIADTQFYRILLWHNKDIVDKQVADIIIGQKDFDSCGQNQFGIMPSEKSLNWVYDLCFYKNGLFVSDTGNSRILWFDNIPKKNNENATCVIGKPDFCTGSENKYTLMGTESSLYWPFSISIQEQQLVIADTGNHRIVLADILF